ncbi:uncharacterized protein LOC119105370 [Pollicipes pollicipes]|uniref:uncharacterized protein LOC119105363 n=1 Tax=Pollicipes pollicipes TaxID=41117 RepID=UPI0018853320|nr:uncharacterized protein LOC119105363 [Pollicipes pollicipes]XP_037084733.1 uncharacterized protein LOC119105370 [Pollicipes pollicipes]
MAATGGLALSLLVVTVLLVSADAFGYRRDSVSPFTLLAERGCLPDNFTEPAEVTAALAACRPQRSSFSGFGFRRRRGRYRRSPFGFFRRHRRSGAGTLLQCLAERLEITNSTGLNVPALETLIDSLSSNTTWTDQQKANVNACVSAMDASLSAPQQGVYILACLKKRALLDCTAASSGTACLRVSSLISHCSASARSLVSRTTWWTCKMGSLSSITLAGLNALGQRLLGSSGETCTLADDAFSDVINCTLQASGLASGDDVNTTAVRLAIEDSGDAQSDKDMRLALLDACVERGAETVAEFIDCWGELAPYSCANDDANQLALSWQPSAPRNNRRFGSRRRFSRRRWGRR